MSESSIIWLVRLARNSDITQLEALIPHSVRALQSAYYSPAQMEAALGPVFGVDQQLIQDGTYFVVEDNTQIVGCGGWSKRRSLFGGGAAGTSEELDPEKDAARVRAFFVHPDWARRGIGRAILAACESAIIAAQFRRAELCATLAGEPLYAAFGYIAAERYEIPLRDGLGLLVVRMTKAVQ